MKRGIRKAINKHHGWPTLTWAIIVWMHQTASIVVRSKSRNLSCMWSNPSKMHVLVMCSTIHWKNKSLSFQQQQQPHAVVHEHWHRRHQPKEPFNEWWWDERMDVCCLSVCRRLAIPKYYELILLNKWLPLWGSHLLNDGISLQFARTVLVLSF